ncbi:hypothetical protein ACOSQ3_028972 [Xanthoceras sorbifolium]
MSWLIWSCRNQAVHGNSSSREDCLWQKAGLFLQDFKVARVKKFSDIHVQISSKVAGWVPPYGASFKLNVDAALDVSGGKFGIGVIVTCCCYSVLGFCWC